jgi:hypothetical protein
LYIATTVVQNRLASSSAVSSRKKNQVFPCKFQPNWCKTGFHPQPLLAEKRIEFFVLEVCFAPVWLISSTVRHTKQTGGRARNGFAAAFRVATVN